MDDIATESILYSIGNILVFGVLFSVFWRLFGCIQVELLRDMNSNLKIVDSINTGDKIGSWE